MELIEDLDKAELKVLQDVRTLVSKIREFAQREVEDVHEGIELLRGIRSSVYEDLNQIQHEYVILRGLIWLRERGLSSGVAWEWNPRQTGSKIEPDLRGLKGGVLVSAEATASENPKGTIGTRVKHTLAKLEAMEGQRFFFVRTESMARYAQNEVRKRNLSIEVVKV